MAWVVLRILLGGSISPFSKHFSTTTPRKLDMVDSLAKFLKAVSRFFFSDFFKPVSSFTPYLNYPPYLSDTMQVTGSTAQEYDDPNTMMKDYVNCAAILE